MSSVIHRFVPALVCASLLGTILVAQQAPPPPASDQPQVTFKVEVNYVEVDAAVFDRQGAFVSDLGRDDFEVFEDGQRQDINAFALVDIPVERLPRPLQVTPTPIVAEPDVVSNQQPFEGRVYVIIMDDIHANALRTARVKIAAREFISTYMADNDVAAVVHTSGRADAGQEFTSNKRLLLAAIDKFMGRKVRSQTLERLDEYQRQRNSPQAVTRIDDPLDMQRGYDARMSLETLQRISDWMGSIRGRRKAILLLSEGIDYNIYDFTKRESSTIQEGMRNAIAAATRSNVSIYSIDPRGLTNLGDETIEASGGFPDDPSLNLSLQSFQDELRLSQDSLRSLSDETGGFAAVNRNDFSEAYGRVVRDNSAYYVLGYYPKNDRRDGRFRKIEVKVRKPGLEVRSRRGYTAPRGKAPAPPKPGPSDKASPQLREALDSPLPLSALTIHAFAAPFKDARPDASVAVIAELEGRDFSFTEKEGRFVADLEVSAIAIDSQGKIRGGERSSVSLPLKPESRALIEQTGVRVASRMKLPPGRYQIRVAAREAVGGRVGSVTYDVDIPDFSKEPLTMSGVVMASALAARITTVKPDDELKAVLPGPPTAIREFPRGDTLAVFTEVYDNAVQTPHKVDITTTVTSAEGSVAFKTSEERSSAELQGKAGGYGHLAQFALKDFAPGQYYLAVEARSRVADSKPVRHVVPFIVR
jgi:VWFA-related protein